jgi:hypothetical protein
MGNQLKVCVRCPNCGNELMCRDILVDKLDSIHFAARIAESRGDLYLSQIYGSYNKIFRGIEDIPDAVVECFCPECQEPFPTYGLCDCKAPMIGLNLKQGGMIKVCTRNGCKKHSLEFENSDDAFAIFQSQDEVGLF